MEWKKIEEQKKGNGVLNKGRGGSGQGGGGSGRDWKSAGQVEEPAHVPKPNTSHHVLRAGFTNTYDPKYPWQIDTSLPHPKFRFLGLLGIGLAGQTALNLGRLSDALELQRGAPPTKITCSTSDGASNMLAPNGLSEHKKSRSLGAVIGLLIYSLTCHKWVNLFSQILISFFFLYALRTLHQPPW
jgi:hypothetical protein